MILETIARSPSDPRVAASSGFGMSRSVMHTISVDPPSTPPLPSNADASRTVSPMLRTPPRWQRSHIRASDVRGGERANSGFNCGWDTADIMYDPLGSRMNDEWEGGKLRSRSVASSPHMAWRDCWRHGDSEWFPSRFALLVGGAQKPWVCVSGYFNKHEKVYGYWLGGDMMPRLPPR